MFGSIYIGMSGLSAYSRGLQQISANVANLNSQGFKGSTVSFRSLLGRSSGALGFSRAGGAAGVALGDQQLDLTQGELRQTSRDLDLAVDGNGFLMLIKGSEVAYTRTGSFEVDVNGNIVLSGTDYRLATLTAEGSPVSLSVATMQTNPPKPTSTVTFSGNLSSSATSDTVSGITAYDGVGGKHVWQAAFSRTVNTSPWAVTITDETGATVGTGNLTFTNGVLDASSAHLKATDPGTGASVVLDFSAGVTGFSSGSASTLKVGTVDGYGAGELTSLTVNDAGQIELGYSNDQKTKLGSVAVADFRDPSALEQQSGGLFMDHGQAGLTLLATGDPRVGKVEGRRLEASNVDLTAQFSDLILVQRGFQASSQIISVSNDMLQQLFGMRGQG